MIIREPGYMIAGAVIGTIIVAVVGLLVSSFIWEGLRLFGGA